MACTSSGAPEAGGEKSRVRRNWRPQFCVVTVVTTTWSRERGTGNGVGRSLGRSGWCGVEVCEGGGVGWCGACSLTSPPPAVKGGAQEEDASIRRCDPRVQKGGAWGGVWVGLWMQEVGVGGGREGGVGCGGVWEWGDVGLSGGV